MKHKKLFILILAFIGVIGLSTINKIQASEITSVFTGAIFTRSSGRPLSETNTKNLKIVSYRRSDRTLAYTWNNTTDGGGKTAWKIVSFDENDEINYKDLIYCLNPIRGFNNGNEQVMAEGSEDSYKDEFDMYSGKNKIIDYAGGDLSENYNKILWILENSYVPTINKNENVRDDKYQQTRDYIDFMEKTGIAIDQNNSECNLTEDDIEVVQQMAIWYFANSDENQGYHNINLPSLTIDGHQLSSIGTQREGYKRKEKAEQLYSYFIEKADENYTNQAEPDLKINDDNITIEEEETNYIVGPYTLEGKNLDKIKDIKDNIDIEYILLDNNKTEIEKNDFLKILKQEIKSFYLKISKDNITTSTNINININYYYDMKKLTFITDVSDYTNTQPAVIVTVETNNQSIITTTPIKLIDIKVEKKWEDEDNQDGARPDSIKVQLYKNGEEVSGEIKTLTKDNWTCTWEKLLVNNNDEYNVKEVGESNKIINFNGNEYSVEYDTQTTPGTIIITNKHETDKTEVSVIKKWDDNNNQDRVRPDKVTVKLYKTVGDVKKEIEDKKQELSSANDWKYTWKNLPKYENGMEIKYTTEEVIPDNYTASYSEDTFTITNTYKPGTISKKVQKIWEDEENKYSTRPNEVTVQLYANGNIYKEEKVLNEQNNWSYTWTELPEKANGEAINYTIKEIKIGDETVKDNSAAGYIVENIIDEDGTTIIKNKYEQNKTSKTVTKVWDDNNYINRPTSIKFQLYKNDEPYGDIVTLTAGEDNIWQENELLYTWIDLPDEEDIKYTVKELDNEGKPIENNGKYNAGYTTTYSNDTFTVTNTYRNFDLALRKFITKVNDTSYSREPIVDTSTIATKGTATYKHSKQPVTVSKGDIVTYTIRVYNEGEVSGYAEIITDRLPNGIIPIIKGTDGIDSEKYSKQIEDNDKWLWTYNAEENTISTTITSKSNTDTYSLLTELEDIKDTKIDAYVNGSSELDYIDVQIKCLVTDNVKNGEYLTNIAEITEMKDESGRNIATDRDSTIGNVNYSNLTDYKNEEAIKSNESSYIHGQEDDDDFEKLVVKEFDLSLQKFAVQVNETELKNEDGKYTREPKVDASKLDTINEQGKIITTATYVKPEEPVIVTTGDLVTYVIRVYNEGSLDGYANEIEDNIPEGLQYIPDSSINKEYAWKMLDSEGKETENVEKAVKLKTEHLSKSNPNNVITSVEVDSNGNKILKYKDVRIQFKVIATAKKLQENTVKNIATLIENKDRDDDDEEDTEIIKLQYYDLALRKFITKVNTTEYNNRYPEINYKDDGQIEYKHTKEPVIVATGDTIIYTIRVYNEGEIAGSATEISDIIPDGLEYLPENEINKKYGWKLVDEEGNITEDISKAKNIVTDILKNENIEAYIQKGGQKVLSYKDVQVAFKVIATSAENKIIVNIAEITKDNGEDIDSIPGNNNLEEDDIDREYLKVEYFDLTLKKWVTETRITVDGKTTISKTGFAEDSDQIAKVDLVGKKINKTTLKFVYKIKVINEGEIEGTATQIKDYIPSGLEFIEEENPDWKEVKKGEVVTEKLKDTILKPGESATVEIVLNWKKSTTNMGLKTNYAEISEDTGDDIDSTPNNFDLKEDDIDDAQVLISIKTAGTKTYILLIMISIFIFTAGVYSIKKYVIK